MSKQATEFQKKEMSKMYRGKEIFKPLNTGWIDENVACLREWVANIFFYRKGGTTIMIDAGYNYDLPSTIRRSSGKRSGSGCSASTWIFSPTGAPIWAAKRTSTTEPAAPTTASPS